MEFERYADIKRLNFIEQTLKARLPEGAEVLDVGCGNGVISRKLGELGFTVRGIDVSDKAIEKARQLNKWPKVNFEVKSAEQLAADGQRYHAVICSEVLEHLNEPSRLLNVIHQILTDDGVLIATVPNGNGPRELFVTRPYISLQKKNNWMWRFVQRMKSLFGYRGTTVQSDADDLTHIQFFTQNSLNKLAASTHFNIEYWGKTNFVEDVFPYSFFTKKIKGLQKLDCAVAEWLPYSFTGGFVMIWKKCNK